VCIDHRSIYRWCLESFTIVFCRESHLVFYKTIICVINILFVTRELCITLILFVCVTTLSWAHILLGMWDVGSKKIPDEASTSRSWTFTNTTTVNTSVSRFAGRSSFA
jgi:hypothetical protein